MAEVPRRVELKPAVTRALENEIYVGVIGAGSYVPAMLLPHFKAAGVNFKSIATASGVSAVDVGKRFGFEYAVSSAGDVLDDAQTNLIVIGTRHDLHAELTIAALQRNKNVLVEKPLALNDDELDQIIAAAKNSSGRLMVGFNRRFAPLARKVKEFFSARATPLSILYRVNAGHVAKDHWAQDRHEGGGRIVGEVCHFVDFIQFIVSSPPITVFAEAVNAKSDQIVDADSVLITLTFADGSNGSIAYVSEGDKSLAKERIEIFGGGRSLVLDDFKRAYCYRNGREESIVLRAQDKGQQEQVRAICASILQGEPAPISLEELATTTRTTFRILDSLRMHQPIVI